MNFTTIVSVTKFWGHLLPNNSTWVGMIALLLDNKVDFGLSSIADRPFRRDVVDFNIPTNDIRLSCFFQRPPAVSAHLTALTKPFQAVSWVAVILLVIGMSCLAFIINKVLRNCRNNPEFIKNKNMEQLPNHFEHDADYFWSMSDAVMWSVTAISLRGFYKLPIENSLRITMIAGSVAGILLYAAYSGTLISFLSVGIEPISNLAQLLATSFTFVVVDYELPVKFLSESPDPKGVMLFRRRKTDKSYNSMKEARDEIIKGSFVFVIDHAGAYASLTTDFTTQEACRIREIEIPNGRQKQGTLVQKNSPYKRIIDYQILKTIQFGLVKRWSFKYFKQKAICEENSTYDGVPFLSVSLSFITLLIFGWFLGCFILLMEVFRKNRSQHLPVIEPFNCAKDFVL